jgi:uncharacterized LabA/DUF88 family protein
MGNAVSAYTPQEQTVRGESPVSETYAFIDGAYFREVTSELIQKMFGVEPEIDYRSLLMSLRHSASPLRRVFYYDCLDDIQKNGESAEDFETRVQAQRVAFDLIQSTEGFHVRLGSLSGKGNRKRQKKVDVLLAVEALDHAFRRNMAQVCLITGDLDFSPLVDSLVKLGTYVKVMYEPKSAARELYAAADLAYPIGLGDVYNWSSADFRQKHPIPGGFANGMRPPGVALKTGTAQNKLVELYEQNGMYHIYAPMWDHYSLDVNFPDRVLLERYFGMMYAPIEWNVHITRTKNVA